jgi:hypothetical protein
MWRGSTARCPKGGACRHHEHRMIATLAETNRWRFGPMFLSIFLILGVCFALEGLIIREGLFLPPEGGTTVYQSACSHARL